MAIAITVQRLMDTAHGLNSHSKGSSNPSAPGPSVIRCSGSPRQGRSGGEAARITAFDESLFDSVV